MRRLAIVFILVYISIGAAIDGLMLRDYAGSPLQGFKRAEIRVYDSESDGNLLWRGIAGPELPLLNFVDGYPVNMDGMIPAILGNREVWIELDVEGSVEASGRTLRRPASGFETGEITETEDIDLIIGELGDDLYFQSDKAGFGESVPNERVTVAGALSMQEMSGTPATTSGYGKLFVDDTEGHLMFLKDDGSVIDLTESSDSVVSAVMSVSSSANRIGRYGHMMFVPTEGVEITESEPANNDTIYIALNSSGSTPCSTAPPQPDPIDGITPVCSGDPGTSYGVVPAAGATYYRWTLPTGSSVVSGFGTNIIHAYLGDFDGNICVKAVNECGESPERCFAVTINRPTSPGPITGASLVCSDTTGLPYYIDAVPEATNYIWTLPPGATIASGSGTPSIVVNFGSEDGEVCVRTENSCGRSEPECLAVTITNTPATPGAISGPASVCESTSGTYTIASVPEATNYTWTVPSGASIASGSGTTTIDVNFGTSSGNICVNAQSICGTSSDRCYPVTILYAPVITSHPSDQDVDEGDPATFTVTATGEAPLSYSWQRSTDSGSSWSSVGADSPSYTTPSTTMSMDGYQYRVTVTGVCSPGVTSSVATLTVSSGLYVFTSHTFSNCGVSGRTGPNLTQCRSYYSTSWDDTYLNMTVNGIQRWTVPADGTYRITVRGAQGGSRDYTGGYGATMRGDFVLSEGDVLQILVGQMGLDSYEYGGSSDGGGGGGGSYVVTSGGTPMIIAGGGGGQVTTSYTTTIAGRTTTDGADTYNNGGGNSGSGGQYGITNGPAAGGGGMTSDGGDSGGSEGGHCFNNGGVGGLGLGTSYDGGSGGFGGGGGGWHNSLCRCGGGGGYSGGQGGTWSGEGGQGGGGGSYNAGANQSNTGGSNSGHGSVTIELLP